MVKLTGAGQPGPPAAVRRQMSTGAAILLMTVGAILLFALTAGSPHWLNLRIVGFILIAAGVLGLAVPRLARYRGDRLRRQVAEMSAQDDRVAAGSERDLVRSPDASDARPTLAGYILGLQHDQAIQDSIRDP
jgi:hypothetical protein